MATKMNDERGCSVCAAESENCEFFTTRLGRKVYHRMQYDSAIPTASYSAASGTT